MCEAQPKPMGPGSTVHRPEDFQRAYGDRDWRFYKGLLATCIRYGEPGRILDLGAGAGLFVECCMRYGLECIGIEGSEWACRKAEERCGAKMIRADLSEPFRLPDGQFSVVVCNQVVEHVHASTVQLMLRESFRVLQPGGVIIINSPSSYSREGRCEPTHINLYAPSRLHREVEEAGFEIVAELNGVRPVLGTNRLSLKIVQLLARVTKSDFLSDTANCIAKKRASRFWNGHVDPEHTKSDR